MIYILATPDPLVSEAFHVTGEKSSKSRCSWENTFKIIMTQMIEESMLSLKNLCKENIFFQLKSSPVPEISL